MPRSGGSFGKASYLAGEGGLLDTCRAGSQRRGGHFLRCSRAWAPRRLASLLQLSVAALILSTCVFDRVPVVAVGGKAATRVSVHTAAAHPTESPDKEFEREFNGLISSDQHPDRRQPHKAEFKRGKGVSVERAEQLCAKAPDAAACIAQQTKEPVLPTTTRRRAALIGVLAQGPVLPFVKGTYRHLLRDEELLPEDGGPSYVSASYVKFIGASGSKAVPVPAFASDAEYRELFEALDGLILPGGEAAINEPSAAYYRAARLFLDWAKEANDSGRYFPVFGICLGFEAMLIWGSGGRFDYFTTDDYRNLDRSRRLTLLPGALEARFFGGRGFSSSEAGDFDSSSDGRLSGDRDARPSPPGASAALPHARSAEEDVSPGLLGDIEAPAAAGNDLGELDDTPGRGSAQEALEVQEPAPGRRLLLLQRGASLGVPPGTRSGGDGGTGMASARVTLVQPLLDGRKRSVAAVSFSAAVSPSAAPVPRRARTSQEGGKPRRSPAEDLRDSGASPESQTARTHRHETEDANSTGSPFFVLSREREADVKEVDDLQIDDLDGAGAAGSADDDLHLVTEEPTGVSPSLEGAEDLFEGGGDALQNVTRAEAIAALLQEQPSSYFHHHRRMTRVEFESDPHLTKNFQLVATARVGDGSNPDGSDEIVAIVEAKGYPFYGFQHHPEKPLFEHCPVAQIPHDMVSRMISLYTAAFVGSEANKSPRAAERFDKEWTRLFERRTPFSTSSPDKPYVFEQVYFFSGSEAALRSGERKEETRGNRLQRLTS
ncbi:gamma-glutamyl hydrolase [Besnoitia besnoiti]|uniref:folate gamma-glutamyl hydrolase n=1 Tax=Besnoitia besnoiti TaxID=94643 RepID=A0A2A9MLA1_BESBE|nr:gamma-glutamyl hydrolase [Besnoitia besnoiti]PFH36463.1 gamma-glutamyl hydrolase [Besnoitia besnoiti]